ncbi:PLP-dependent aminotransferase family protein [Mycobacterium sp. 141]|uniref:MocR-like pyridoxine biosynthesis transcription factor PdxR n=1 Tax=Mycobacterium sp. 141 TaxID=1120797 RepID=UPI0003A6AEF6|nr:PLP-dependent aminotransferase family protein [Mycobacterium sp. 141]
MTSDRNKPAHGGSAGVKSGVPAYKVLYEQLRSAILTGQLAAGARLPASRVLAADHGVSRNTVLAAFDQLGSEGYVEGRAGSGTYVSRVLPEQYLQMSPFAVSAASARPATATLSQRGQRLAAARRVPLPALLHRRPRGTAFHIGLPALDAFPFATWNKLYSSRLNKSGPSLMRYDDPAGYRPLREAIAAYIGTARGIHCTADHIIVTTGSQQALDFCARILLDPGDAAWLEEPGYLGARAALVAADARIIPVPVDRFGLDVAAGISSEPAARLAIVTPSHQFPLGHTMSLERRLALIDWADRNNAWILEDDYDAEFRYVGRPQAPLKAIDTHQRVIYIGTFSKVLFPGLRLGYLIAPADLTDGFIAAHLGADMHAHLTDQAVVADFMEQGHFVHHLRRMRTLHAERQHQLIREAEPLSEHLELKPSDGGLHLIGRMHTAATDTTVTNAALQQGVHVWPLSIHHYEPNHTAGLLLGYAGTTRADVREGVRVLDDILKSR